MTRPILAPVAICAALTSLASVQWLLAQTRTTLSAGPASFETAVQPVLAKNCLGCHNEKLKSGNLNLEAFHDGASAARQPEVWTKVLDKLNAGKMPPPGLPPIAKAD